MRASPIFPAFWVVLYHSLVLCLILAPVPAFASEPPNVLFIAIDDLRPDLNCYEETAAEQMGGPEARLPVQTPAMDSIASEGMVFERAYCQVSLCGPSRVSLMTSTYPDRTGIYNMNEQYGGDWRAYTEPSGLNLVSLPQQFRSHGYVATSYGKIYDNRLGTDLGISWDIQLDELGGYVDSQNNANRCAIEAPDVSDDAYRDGKNTDLALNFLATHDHATPFFLAVGFAKPHLPFNAPKQYWDLYTPNTFPLGAPTELPTGLSDYTLSRPYKELETYTQPVTYAPIEQPTSEALTRQLIHGYLACISYVDTQIAKIISDLKTRGLYDNTIIVIWGDHGFKLADFGEWAKATTLEIDSRVPLIIRLPTSMTANRDAHSYSMVELVDVMPTICEAAGLPIPATVQGRSLMPILENASASVRQTALSQYKRSPGMAYSVRSEQWRYTEFRTNSGNFVERQLFDLSSMPPVEVLNVTDTESYFSDALSALIFDYSQAPLSVGDGLTIHFGNDNLVNGDPQDEIPGQTGTFSLANVSARMNATGAASSYTTGGFYEGATGLTFDISVSSNRSHLKAQPAGLGIAGGSGNSVIDNDFGNTNFQESLTFSLENIIGVPSGYTLAFTGLTLEFAEGEPVILNEGDELPAVSEIQLTNESKTLTIQAGATSETKFPISSFTVSLVEKPPEPIVIHRTRIVENSFRVDLTGQGTYSVWESRTLTPPLFTGPTRSGVSTGIDVVLDAEIAEPMLFYQLLPDGETP